MPIDKATMAKLRKFAKVFAEASQRDANESDTVMYLVEFFKEVLDYDPLCGEIVKEVPINDRFCDLAIRPDDKSDKIAFLVEAKPAGIKVLKDKHIEQAENYASHAGINWVVLTSGVMWQLYHLTFGNDIGIARELVIDLNFPDALEDKPAYVWDTLSVLSKRNVREGSLDTYYEQQKLLSPKNVVNLLLSEEVLMKLRQELNRKAPARLDLGAVFHAVVHVLNPEAVASAGEIDPPAKRRRHHKHRKDEGVGEDESREDGAQIAEEKEAPESQPQNPAAP